MCANPDSEEQDLKSVCSSSVVQDEGLQTNARAAGNKTTGSREDMAIKKRKTRRGKSKRRNHPNPYTKLPWQQRKNVYNQGPYSRKYSRSNNIIPHGQALAPFNSNQFLMEDHGELQEIDEKLNKSDGAGTSTNPPRTRDSSFSVDSEGDFYSSPEDEEEFLSKEFSNAYEDLHAERLQSLSKAQLIEEYLQLESKVDLLTQRLRGKSTTIAGSTNNEPMDEEEGGTANENSDESAFQQEINKLLLENDELRRENEHLRNGVCRTASSFSSSMDSESDSSSSTCNTTTSTTNSPPAREMKDIDAADQENAANPPPLTNGYNSPPPKPSSSPLNV